MNRKRLALCALIGLLSGCAARKHECWQPIRASREGHALRIVGTFTSLDANGDRGGVFGAEVRIAVSDDPPYQAVVQFGYGDVCGVPKDTEACWRLSPLYLVAADFDYQAPHEGGTAPVRFVIPPPAEFAGTFEGLVSHEGLEGTFRPQQGPPRRLVMRRAIPYYEQ